MAKAATDGTTELPDRPSFQEAFQAAKAQHSSASSDGDDEHALDDDEEASTDTDEEAGETEDSETAEETTDDAAGDKADGKKKAVEAKTEKGEKAKKGKDATGLLTDEEFTALQTTHADDPKALRKALEGAFTKKTQKIAEEHKSVERLRSYSDIIDAYETDPVALIKALAKQHSIDFTTTAAGDTATTEETETTVDEVLGEFKEALGPDLEYLADGLAPAITKLVERLAAQTVDKATAPLKNGQKVLLDKVASEQTDAVMATLEKTHPDWKDHEDAMFALSQKFQLVPGQMTEIEYLETLYDLATRDARAGASKKATEKEIADGVKKALKRMEEGATNTDTKTRHTPDGQVTTGPPNGRAPSFAESYAAAKRGERWE